MALPPEQVRVAKHLWRRYFDWPPMKSRTARLKISGCSQYVEWPDSGISASRLFGISASIIREIDGGVTRSAQWQQWSMATQLDNALVSQRHALIPRECGEINERTSYRSSRCVLESAENGIHSCLITRSLGFEPLHDIRVDPQRQRCLWRDRPQPSTHNRSRDVLEVELGMLFR